MNCHELAQRVERLQSGATIDEVARLCLLICNSVEDIDTLRYDEALQAAWHETGMRLQLVTDQHAAMTQELEELASSDPEQFSRDQIWVLIRAIKVQSQVLQMYMGQAALDV